MYVYRLKSSRVSFEATESGLPQRMASSRRLSFACLVPLACCSPSAAGNDAAIAVQACHDYKYIYIYIEREREKYQGSGFAFLSSRRSMSMLSLTTNL